MKKSFYYGFLVILLVFLANGCCKQIRPRKIVFTPELQIALDHEIEKLGTKNPVLFIVGDGGQVIALTIDGKTFDRCRPPDLAQGQDSTTKQSDVRKEGAMTDRPAKQEIMESDLPVCQGMQNIKEIFPFETVTIMKNKKNPWCRVVAGPDGAYEERCLPFPW
jgi:hypothetical protein